MGCVSNSNNAAYTKIDFKNHAFAFVNLVELLQKFNNEKQHLTNSSGRFDPRCFKKSAGGRNGGI